MNPDNKANEKVKIAICGGGLVGCLAACYFGQRNFDVTLYEYRSDIRKMKVVVGRSINMAMSVRGRDGLKGVGVEQSITSKGIEMYSRMLHDTAGNMSQVPYGTKSQCILSIDRRFLNELLLTEAEKYANVKICYEHKLIKCNTNTGELVFEKTSTKEIVETKCDLIVGCDGAYSSVRQSLMKDKPINFSQTYISSYYLELQIPPKNGTFALPPKHLHIWPRGNFMLIALPNQDFSFTCTLFMPIDMFKEIKTQQQCIDFFKKHFPNALELMGTQHLIDIYFSSKPSPLVYVRCDPHHGEKCVLLGDAAHAIVPFYGQGMNCGFEDCVVFFELLDKFGFQNLDSVLKKYSEQRVPDANAIAELALRNYQEMSYLVTTRGYKLRKSFDAILHRIFPKSWVPLYTMVTFTRIRYSDVIRYRENQNKLVKIAGSMVLASFVSLAAVYSFKLMKKF